MTVTEVQTQARAKYNATGDGFFGDTELNNYIWEACHILAREGWLIERIYTASTVASTQDYAHPTNTLAIKRITVDGKKIKPITFRDDDAITLSNSNITSTGIPVYYTDFNYTLSLRPAPDSVYTIKIYSFNDAQQITNTSTLEIPSLWHLDILNYVLSEMYAKDENIIMANYYLAKWERTVLAARRHKAKAKRTDAFATVQDEDTLPVTILGEA